MKKLILFSLCLAFVATACYDDYKTDYEYTAAYFSNQYPARTVIINSETQEVKVQVGATFGGLYSYEEASEDVTFEIVDTLITNDTNVTDLGIKVMPASWYTLSDESQIKIRNANHGFVEVNIIRDSLIKHSDATQNTYAIPFLITHASTDSILTDKNFSIVVIKYTNNYAGRYYVKGVDHTLNSDGSINSGKDVEYNDPALVLNKFIYLNAAGADMVSVPRIGSKESKLKYVYDMQINGSSAVITANENSDITEVSGSATYNTEEETFICNYNYTLSGSNHSVVDTLIFSNTEIVKEDWMND